MALNPSMERTPEFELWLNAAVEEALRLQTPVPDDMLEIVAEGAKADPPRHDL
jgi:cytochrome P450